MWPRLWLKRAQLAISSASWLVRYLAILVGEPRVVHIPVPTRLKVHNRWTLNRSLQCHPINCHFTASAFLMRKFYNITAKFVSKSLKGKLITFFLFLATTTKQNGRRRTRNKRLTVRKLWLRKGKRSANFLENLFADTWAEREGRKAAFCYAYAPVSLTTMSKNKKATHASMRRRPKIM